MLNFVSVRTIKGSSSLVPRSEIYHKSSPPRIEPPVIEPQKWGPMEAETGRASQGDNPWDRADKAPRRCKSPSEDR